MRGSLSVCTIKSQSTKLNGHPKSLHFFDTARTLPFRAHRRTCGAWPRRPTRAGALDVWAAPLLTGPNFIAMMNRHNGHSRLLNKRCLSVKQEDLRGQVQASSEGGAVRTSESHLYTKGLTDEKVGKSRQCKNVAFSVCIEGPAELSPGVQ